MIPSIQNTPVKRNFFISKEKNDMSCRIGYATKNKTLSDLQNVHLSRTLPLFCITSSGLIEGIKRLQEISKRNLTDLLQVLHWNRTNNIRPFVIPFGIFPYAADPYYGYSITFAKGLLQKAGTLARKGKQRILFHLPPEISWTLLSKQSHQELIFLRHMNHLHEMISMMRIEKPTIILSFSKADSIDGTIENLQRKWDGLPSHLKFHIALENDPFNFPLHILLPFCQKNMIPLVINTHHDMISRFPVMDSFMIINYNVNEWKEIENLWNKLGKRQIVLYSEPLVTKGTMGEKLQRKSYVAKLPPFLQELKNCDIIVLSDAYEQSCRDIPRTNNRNQKSESWNESYDDIRRVHYKKGLKILSELP